MSHKTNFFERLMMIAEHYGVQGIPGLSKRLGYKSAEKLYRLDRNATAKPSLDIVLDLTNKFESLNLEWFLTGKGEIEKGKAGIMLSETTVPYETQKNVVPKVVTVNPSGNDSIVLVTERAAAGYLNGYGDPKFIHSLPTYYLPNLNNGTFRMFQVTGHSMYPTLHSGSFVVGEWVENWVEGIKDDRIYVIISKKIGITVKRVLNRIEKYNSLYCKSDNRSEYSSFGVEPKEILEIWAVKMYLGTDLPNPVEINDRVNDLEVRIMNLESRINRK